MSSTNPYQASEVGNEQSVEQVRFLRVSPVPKKTTFHDIGQVTYQAFMSRKQSFIGFGMMQFFFGLMSFWIIILASETCVKHLEQNDFLISGVSFLAFGFIMLLDVLIYIASTKAVLRLLRNEKMTFFPSRGELSDLIKTTFRVSFYFLIFGTIAGSVILLDGWLLLLSTNAYFRNEYWHCLVLFLFLMFVFFFLWLNARYLIGIHYIIDKQVTLQTALAEIGKYTKINTYAIVFSFIAHFFIFYILSVITFGILVPIIPSYFFCWLSVIYMLTTNQCEQLTDTPEEW